MVPNDLVGLKWPVQNTNNEIVGFRIIKHAVGLENVAGYVISLDKSFSSGITVGFMKALELIKDNQNSKFDSLKELE